MTMTPAEALRRAKEIANRPDDAPKTYEQLCEIGKQRLEWAARKFDIPYVELADWYVFDLAVLGDMEKEDASSTIMGYVKNRQWYQDYCKRIKEIEQTKKG